jgi:aspartyl-tRNA(Asn)/glutamyl-tRNA(Gln) amidotransferase subunit C
MPITENEIEKVALLAHLEVAAAELKVFAHQIADIIGYVEQLNSVDTANVEPAIGGLTAEGEKTLGSRADETSPSLGQRLALEEAPDPASGHFRVPKVL